MKLRAPAKINLSLKISARRSDGYHELETFMVPVGVWDTLHLERLEEDGKVEFSCDDPSLGEDMENNLVVKAARAFFKSASDRKIKGGIRVHLEKRIPHGAGLGGGSSDGAWTIRGMNQIFATGYRMEEMEALAAEFGSDTSFFVRSVPAICRGRGEKIEPVKLEKSYRILLVKPPFSIATKEAYGLYGKEKGAAEEQELDGMTLSNDLEPAVFSKYLVLPVLKRWLLERPEIRVAMMSGSGSTMFGVLEENAETEELLRALKKEFGETWWTCVSAVNSGA